MDELLTKALERIQTRAEKPHCFSAFVKGKGYVNNGELPHNIDDYWTQAYQAAVSEVENMGFAPKYCEPGYEQPAKAILLADWNHLPSSLEKELEQAGYSIEWADEWVICDNCNGALRTQPDSYGWTPNYVEYHGEFLCKDCNTQEDERAEQESLTEDEIPY